MFHLFIITYILNNYNKQLSYEQQVVFFTSPSTLALSFEGMR